MIDAEAQLKTLLSFLHALQGASITVSRPAGTGIVTWIDIDKPPHYYTVQFHPKRGIGLHIDREASFTNPEEVYQDAPAAIRRLVVLLA